MNVVLFTVRYTPLATGLLIELGGGLPFTTIVPYEHLRPEWQAACDGVREAELLNP